MSTTKLESRVSDEARADNGPNLYTPGHSEESVDVVSPEVLVKSNDFVWVCADHSKPGDFMVFSFGRSYVGRLPSGYLGGAIARRPLSEFRSLFMGVKGASTLYVSKDRASRDGMIKQVPGLAGAGSTVTIESVAARLLEPYSYEFAPGRPMRSFRDFSYTAPEEQWAIADIAFRCLSRLESKHFEIVPELLRSLTSTPDTGDARVDAHKVKVLNGLYRTYREEFIRRKIPWLLTEQDSADVAHKTKGLRARVGAVVRRLTALIPGHK